MLPTSNSKTTEELINISMANRPLAYKLSERKATIGKMAGKTVIQASSTGQKPRQLQ